MKIKNVIQQAIVLLLIAGFFYSINQYDKITSFYIQKKENYSDLKKLKNEILDENEIDLKSNKLLYELNEKIEYEEYMINQLEPNLKIAKHYWWVIIALILTLAIIGWRNNKHIKKI
jgi:hypothetical protein